MHKFDNPNALLTLEEVAEYVGCARSTVYRLVAEGELPRFFKIGKINFMRVATLRTFIEKREQSALAA
ncbi:transcriptional regulator, AlpA family [Rhizobium sp. RU20A]|nr:transcriptional regulator, AlpA family [Rhizobium sp. RU20A]